MKQRKQIIDEMKERVFKANLKLPELGLVVLTWGNVSEINRELGVIVIKPSGLDYSQMTSSQMVVTDMEGEPLEGGLKPSSDLKSHVILYQHFEEISAIVHTHSRYAVSWSQSGRDLPVYGTTHADTFYGPVPTTRQLNNDEVDNEYEMNTGKVIVKTFQERQLSPLAIPGILVNGHGPFTWGANPNEAVENSLVLDEICSMAQLTETIMTSDNFLPQYVLDKHYFRKHGKNAYYGQK